MTHGQLRLLVSAGVLQQTTSGEYRIARGFECFFGSSEPLEPTADNRPSWAYDPNAPDDGGDDGGGQPIPEMPELEDACGS